MATPAEFYKNLSPYEKAKLTGTLSMLFNFAAGAFKFVAGMLTYVAALCISGLDSVFCGAAKRIYFGGMRASMGNESRECGYYLAMGGVLIVSSAFHTVYMYGYAEYGSAGRPGAFAVVAVCVLAAVELIVSLAGFIRARRDGDLLMEGLRFVNLYTASAAIVTALAAVSAALGAADDERTVFGGAAGVVSGIAGMLAGAFMTIKGAVLSRRYAKRPRVRILRRK